MHVKVSDKSHDVNLTIFISKLAKQSISKKAVVGNLLIYLYNTCVIMNYHMNWKIEFYKDKEGQEPVIDFLDSLFPPARAKAVKLFNMLVEYGVLLKEPYTKQIKGKIRELRIKDSQGAIRVLYFTYTGRRFVLLHGFIKKTDKTPEREIEIAEKRMNDFIQREGVEK